MEIPKRCKNFTEREKMLLLRIAKEFSSIIDNKKTDATTVEAKKQAWQMLASKYNAVSETGIRTKKQLHSLYDNLKKRARNSTSDDRSQMYNTEDYTFCSKPTSINEIPLITPKLEPLSNEFDSSAPYYKMDIETSPAKEVPTQVIQDGNMLIEYEVKHESVSNPESPCNEGDSTNEPAAPLAKSPTMRKSSLTEIKKKNIVKLSSAIVKRKKQKIMNEDIIMAKRLEILETQHKEALQKLEKAKILFDLDIELKRVLLENAKLDLELKKQNFK